MQTDMPVEMLGEELVERFRRAWWTAYILDRELTSSMGLPQSTHEEDVCPKLPTFKGSNRRTSVLGMQIQLSQVIATINRGKLLAFFLGETNHPTNTKNTRGLLCRRST